MRKILFLLLGFHFTIASAQSSDTHVTMHDKKQYYELKGKGEPVIVFLTGAGVPMSEVSWFADSLSHISRTLCYDRAGIGKSEFITSNRNLEKLDNELTNLLDQLNLKNPIVLVAHSRGALLARYFAHKHPLRVAAMLLLDPALPEWRGKRRELRNEKEKVSFDSLYKSLQTDTVTYPLIVRREMNPKPSDSAYVADIPLPKTCQTTIIASVKPGNDKYSEEDIKIKKSLLKKLIKGRARFARLVLTEKSGHFIYEDEPKLVLRELRLMFYLNKMLPGKTWGVGVGY